MLSSRLISTSFARQPSLTACRSVSSKYPRPTPRHFRRRLFEAAIQPILPKEIKACTPPAQYFNSLLKEQKEYTDVELALCGLVKKWLTSQEFRVMAICQFMPVQGRTLTFFKNQQRLKGIEFRNYGNRIMKKVFEGTPLCSLDVVLTGSNACLFGKSIDDVKTIVQETDKVNFLIPLAFVIDGRIVSMDMAKELAALPDMNQIRAETVSVLSSQLGLLPSSLDRAHRDLSSSLDIHIQSNEKPSSK